MLFDHILTGPIEIKKMTFDMYEYIIYVTGGLDPQALTALDASGFNADSE